MLISYFYPNDWHTLFIPHVKNHKFLYNHCTKEADLIYCGSASQLKKAIKAKEEYNKPLICWVWDIPCYWREWTRNEKEFQEHAWRDQRIKGAVSDLHQCDGVISASKNTQRVLKEKYNLESEQIYFYMDFESIDAVPTFKKQGHVIQISRFVLSKRFDISIRAVNKLNKKLVCIGSGNCGRFKQVAQSLSANVDFYQSIERSKLVELLRQAEILVSPSLHEGFGLTPIEAIHCHVPILLSDLEVFKEIYGDSALYHRKDDVEDMREKLGRLLNDKQLQKKIVDDCLPLISDFTPCKFATRWEQMIERV